MKYDIVPSDKFREDALKLYKSEPQAYKKLQKFVAELEVHPRTGTGHPEQLKHYKEETWSRQITRKHRLVYEIHDEEILVIALAAYGHYEDK